MKQKRPDPIFSVLDGEPVVYLPLTQGQFAIVDRKDFDFLSKSLWTVMKNPQGDYYAYRKVDKKSVYLHRVLLGLIPGDGSEVDHRNLNTLDNRRSNLRIATRSGNLSNRGIQSNNTSGYKGVRFDKHRGTWKSEIKKDRRLIFLGRFPTKEEAYQVYREAALKYHGEFARLQ